MQQDALRKEPAGLFKPLSSSIETIGLANFLKLGQAPDDTYYQRQSKAILVFFMLVISGFAGLALLDSGRPVYVHILDVAAIVSSAIALGVLQRTKNLHLTFSIVCMVSLALQYTFFMVVGNRGADLMMPLMISLIAVLVAGPRRSQKWFIFTVLMVLSIPFVDPRLPQINLELFQSARNLSGSLFQAPFKEPIDLSSTLLALTIYGMIYGMVYAGYAQMIHSRKMVKLQRVELAKSYEKSERLLLNILPASVAERLKEDPEAVIADDLDNVVILFADIVNFTKTSADLPASEVVALLNKVFSSFDHLVSQSGVEKIKTSGDAYMVAAGIAASRPDDIQRMADLALAMLQSVEDLNAVHRPRVAVRVGLHAGKATAGVVGSLKFYYDIWGDSVNFAARLQTAAQPGTIRVSETIIRGLGPDYAFDSRGPTPLKGLGDVETFELLRHSRPAASA